MSRGLSRDPSDHVLPAFSVRTVPISSPSFPTPSRSTQARLGRPSYIFCAHSFSELVHRNCMQTCSRARRAIETHEWTSRAGVTACQPPLRPIKCATGGGRGLYAHPPMFGDLPLCFSGQRTCAELEYALRKCFSSVPPLSRPHLARHWRAWGAPAIFSADTFFRRFSHVWQGGA